MEEKWVQEGGGGKNLRWVPLGLIALLVVGWEVEGKGGGAEKEKRESKGSLVECGGVSDGVIEYEEELIMGWKKWSGESEGVAEGVRIKVGGGTQETWGRGGLEPPWNPVRTWTCFRVWIY